VPRDAGIASALLNAPVSGSAAARFQSRYARHLLDLLYITTSLFSGGVPRPDYAQAFRYTVALVDG
jgi:hypothetical protein